MMPVLMQMQISMEKMWAVVITGLAVVFIALLLLILFVTLFGKIFSTSGNSKKSTPAPVPEIKAAPAPSVEIEKTPEPVSTEDDDAVIAAISAAVAMMAASEGKTYAIKSIRKSANQRRSAGSVWGAAGQRENTRPF